MIFGAPFILQGSNPYLDGCIGLWNLGQTLGSAADRSGVGNDAAIADNGSGNITTTTLGGRPAADFDGGSTAARYDLGSIDSGNPLSLVGESVVTVMFRGAGPGAALTTSFPRIIDKSDSGSGANGWVVYLNAANNFVFQCDSSSSAVTTSSVFDTATTANIYALEVRPTGTSQTHRLYKGGSLAETITSTTLAAPGTGTTNAAIGNWNHATSRMFEGAIDFVAVWSRALTAQEHSDIHADPSVLGI